MTNLFKTMSGAMLFAFVLQTGCGSAALQVRDPAGKSPADDVLTFQESVLGLVATSNSAVEAADRVTKYCQNNADAIGGALAAMNQNSPPPADFIKKMQALLERGEKSLGAKAEYMDSDEFQEASAGCFALGRSGADDADEAIEGTFGSDDSDEDSLE